MKFYRVKRITAALTLILGLVVTVNIASAPAAHATSSPSWWNGTCDSNNNPGSYELGTTTNGVFTPAEYDGVVACGPGTLMGGTDLEVHFFGGAWGEYEWECVELVMRYMYLEYGIAPYSADGATVVSNYSGNVLNQVSNNGTSLPSPGDIVSWNGSSSNPDGHTAIVTSVNVTGGSGIITVLQQNATANGWGTVNVSGNVLTTQVDGGGVAGWLHNPSSGGGGGNPNYEPFAADFNGDGLADIGLRDVSDGNFFIKHGPGFNDQILYSWAPGNNYEPFACDFNDDGLADIGLYNKANGIFYIKHGPDFSDQITYHWSAGNYQVFVGDFNGDGYCDIGLRNPANGNFFIKHGPSFSDQIVYTWVTGTNYIPFAADFNGDGLADIGLYNTANGIFYMRHGPSFSDQISYNWASGTNYQPFAADFNGDGLADIGLRNVSNGNFFIKHGPGFNDQIVYTWAAG